MLERDPEDGASEGADGAEDDSLGEENCGGAGGGAPETAEGGDGGEPPGDVDVDGAGDADAAEEEGGEAGEAEETGEAVQGLAEVAFAVGYGFDAEAGGFEKSFLVVAEHFFAGRE